MALTTCGECKREISTTAKACPHCGAKAPSSFSWPIAAAGLVIAVLLIGVLSSVAPRDEERSLRRAEIKLCWEDQARKSMDPSAARMLAGLCEKKEAEFQRLYQVKP